MNHLIANTGLQFVTPEPVELNFAEPVLLPSGKTLKYTFVEKKNFITGDVMFDLACFHSGSNCYVPLSELVNEGAVVSSSGRVVLDESGMPAISPQAPVTLFSTFHVGSAGITNINSLEGFMVRNPDTGEQEAAYLRLMDKWLPMPMFEIATNDTTIFGPIGWCRVKIVDEGEGVEKGKRRYRMVWAFDTQVSEGPSELMPSFFDGDGISKQFCLCNDAGLYVKFLSASGNGNAFRDYLRSLFGLTDNTLLNKVLAYYIYFLNYIRLSGGTPTVTLHNCQDEESKLSVDLVLDVGNSRTCGILFENGSFATKEMLELRDLSEPWKTYNSSFDMRLVFRKTDFGNDILLDDLFNWPSLVRVGEEAQKIVYNARENSGIGRCMSSYSSPKRYLWDDRPFDGRWEFLRVNSDPTGVKMTQNVYIPILSDMFDSEGHYYPEGVQKPIEDLMAPVRYSRSSLMTFVMVEILAQAVSQINSDKYRTLHGNINYKRVLRNIILTCPTAMPVAEQVKLRQSAVDAFDALRRCVNLDGKATVVPSPESLMPADFSMVKKGWSYDEATCCQMVYLYAEIAERYGGQIGMFLDQKGHIRKEDMDSGNPVKSLTICSIDIGAGTTDVMVSKYKSDAKGHDIIVPTPLFWDSYYLAGDEILQRIIQNQIIEGENNKDKEPCNISGFVTRMLLGMTNDEIAAMPCMNHKIAGASYRSRLSDIVYSSSDEDRSAAIRRLAVDLMHDYFGYNSRKMSAKDQHCRIDFVTQIAHPIAQFYLELLRTSHQERLFTFDELLAEEKCFRNNRPSESLLDHFYNHFGFRLEEMRWRFNPIAIADDVRAALESLVKTLSEVVYSYQCDVLVLAGRPTSLDAVTEMFIKYMPISPHRLVRLNSYRVGSWYPFTYGDGYIYDKKTIVAVGGMVGYLASSGANGFGAAANPMMLDFSSMVKEMKSTALYMGEFQASTMLLKAPLLFTPTKGSAHVVLTSRNPFHVGCSQFEAAAYQARPIYSLTLREGDYALPVTVTLTRNYFDNREKLELEDIVDANGNQLPMESVELMPQTLAGNNENEYWLDNGIFDLIIRN